MPTLWSCEVNNNKVILEQVKVAEHDYDYMLQFFKETKTISTYIRSFTSKFIWNHLSIYHLYHLFGIIHKSIFYNLNITLNYWFISSAIKYLG